MAARHPVSARLFLALTSWLVTLALWSTPGFAWGQEGHRIVANIADTRLSPEAVARIHAILGDAPLASIANRPDQILKERPETAKWHFTNIEITNAAYDAARDCVHEDCVVARLDEFRHVLADPGASLEKQREALMFVVHFAGDLHQPLHCADNHDRGGTQTFVTLLDVPDQQLHKVWDTLVIRSALKETGLSEIAYGRSITKELLHEGLAEEVKGGTVAEWANESHDLGRDDAYAFAEDKVYTEDEVAKARAAIERRLVTAGIRLATMLNAAFKPHHHP
jgi:hypothetical protein